MGKRNGLSDFINMSSLKYDSKQKIIEGQIFSCCLAFQSPYLAVIPSYVLCVQEVVTHFYSKLLYKMGHYFLDTHGNFHYLIIRALDDFFFFFSSEGMVF